MDLLFLFSTALAVSIDSFVCGFSLGLNARRKLPVVLGIALTVFLMCLITDALGTALSGILNEDVAALGGLVLIGVADFQPHAPQGRKKHGARSLPPERGSRLAVGWTARAPIFPSP